MPSGVRPDREVERARADERDRQSGLGGGRAGNQGGLFGDRALQDRAARTLDSKSSRSQSIGKGLTGAGENAKKSTVGPGAGVPPFSRTKVKKGVSRTPTPGNVLKGALTALGMGPLAAIGTIAGSEEVDALPDLGMGYEGPVGESEYTEADPSQLGESGMAQSDLAPPPSKKKKNNPLGNVVGTLLADAGGTLVAG